MNDTPSTPSPKHLIVAKDLVVANTGIPYKYPHVVAPLGTILYRWDQYDYSGDSVYILTNGKDYGYLTFGWGSCSGCDSLQACDTIEDLAELLDHLESQIVWFPSKDTLASFLQQRDWATATHIKLDVDGEDGRKFGRFIEDTINALEVSSFVDDITAKK